jgi:TRAP-type C4-dicarboxylate transport system permease small subunit
MNRTARAAPSLDAAGRPRVPAAIEEIVAAAALAAICVITFANVVVRYLTDESFAFTEELSVFLMVVLAFTGAAAAFAKNIHIRVTFFVEKLAPRPAFVVEMAMMATSFVLFASIAWYGLRLVADDIEFETTSPGIGVPQWYYSVWLPILAAAVALRVLGRVVRLWRTRGDRP